MMKIITLFILIWTILPIVKPTSSYAFVKYDADVRWEEIKNSHNSSILLNFIEEFPYSNHASIARNRLKTLSGKLQNKQAKTEWDQIQLETDPDVFEEFIENFPGSPYSEVARFKLNLLLPEEEGENNSNKQTSPNLEKWTERDSYYDWELGILLGLHFFENPNHVHGSYEHDPSDEGAYSLYSLTMQFYLNAYFWGNTGMGFRFHQTHLNKKFKTIEYNGTEQYIVDRDVEISIGVPAITFNWILPYSLNRSWGTYFGLGFYQMDISTHSLGEVDGVGGFIMLPGLFWDVGDSGFGWRIECNYLFAEREELESSNGTSYTYQTVDPSGFSLVGGFRWGF